MDTTADPNPDPNPPENRPIMVALPNTVRDKMEAIRILSHAVNNLSLALRSINVTVELTNCTASHCGIGISIQTDEYAQDGSPAGA